MQIFKKTPNYLNIKLSIKDHLVAKVKNLGENLRTELEIRCFYWKLNIFYQELLEIHLELY